MGDRQGFLAGPSSMATLIMGQEVMHEMYDIVFTERTEDQTKDDVVRVLGVHYEVHELFVSLADFRWWVSPPRKFCVSLLRIYM